MNQEDLAKEGSKMMDLPTIQRKPRKLQYRKPEAVKELERMAFEQACRDHPNTPRHVIAPRKFRDNDSNSLTACITEYLKLKGAFQSRLNNTGIYDKRLQRYRPGTNRKGLPDVVCTYRGKSLFIEVKAKNDKLSESQEKIKIEQENSDGLYYTAHNFSDTKQWIDNL